MNTLSHRVKLGFTFDYFIPGVLLIGIGGAVCVSSLIIGLLMVLFGIALLLLQTTIEIDPVKKRVRKTYDLAFLRFGGWIDTIYFPRVVLSLTSESKTMQHRAGQTNFKTKTYDVIFYDDAGTSIELNDFRNYEMAVKVLGLIGSMLRLETRDQVKERRDAALKRRKEEKKRYGGSGGKW